MVTKAVVDRCMEAFGAAWNEGKLDPLDEFLSPNIVRHVPPFPDLVGRDAYKGYIQGVRVACPDSHVTVDQYICEGDRSAYAGDYRGTFSVPSPIFANLQPAGQKLDFRWCGMLRWEGDKLVEELCVNDYLTMMMQVGVVKL